MNHFSYLFLDLIIGIPAVIIFFVLHKKQILKNKFFFVTAILGGIIMYFLIDPIGVAWQAWGYHADKILDIYPIGGSVLEELFLSILDVILVSIVVLVFAEREEKKKSFWPFL